MKKCPFCAGMHCLLGCLIFLGIFILLTNVFVYLAFIAFKAAMFKISSLGANLPRLFMPLNPFDVQLMLKDLGEGFRAFWENLNGCSLHDYQRIYF